MKFIVGFLFGALCGAFAFYMLLCLALNAEDEGQEDGWPFEGTVGR